MSCFSKRVRKVSMQHPVFSGRVVRESVINWRISRKGYILNERDELSVTRTGLYSAKSSKRRQLQQWCMTSGLKPAFYLRKAISHRIIECPELKRTTMIIEFHPPCYVQGHQPPDQAAQSHIQPGLECLQGWGIHNLLGQPVPVHHHPLSEKLPPNI